MENKKLTIDNDKKYTWHHLSQHKPLETSDPMIIVKGNGMVVTDINGKEYLDCTSGGLWTVNVGFGRESIAEAIKEQLIKLPYFAGTLGNEPGIELAKELIDIMPGFDRVYYSNSGSEANEKAYKIVRQKAHQYNDGKKHKIIYRDRDYHGTTITTLSSTGQEQRKAQYSPFTPGFVEMPHACCYRCPFSKTYPSCDVKCARVLEDIIVKEGGGDSVGSVVLEPMTAGGGVIVPVKEYYPIIQEICKKYGVLIHIDEVVCGLGRTGKWFGYQHYDFKPDIVTSAKGLASGYAAISITATTNEVFDVFKSDASDNLNYFRDVSTFGGCTAGPTASLETLKIIKEENLLENVAIVGEHFLSKLLELQEKYEVIGDVRGKGLLLGVELVKDRKTREPMEEIFAAKIVGHCLKNGVMIGRTNRCFEHNNNVLIFSPAFICTKNDIDIIVSALDTAIQDSLAS